MMEGAGIASTPDLIATQQMWGTALYGIGLIAMSLRDADNNVGLIEPVKAVMIICFLAVLVTLYHLYQGFSGPPIYMNIVVQGLAGIGILLKTK